MLWKWLIGATLFAAGLMTASSAQAGTDVEIAELRAQLKLIKESYEARIQALEQRLQQLEATANRPPTTSPRAAGTARIDAPAPSSNAAAVTPPPAAAGEGAFNPAISVVLNGTYGNFSQDPDRYSISGFVPPNNGLSPGKRGLSLRESELAIAANIDPDFRGNLLISFDEGNQLSVEEAYVQTIGLGNGLSVKGGRFFSALGYQNEIHSHAWDFVDAPLIQRAFLSGENYADDGLQVKWLAPSESLIELGGEIGRGKDRPGSNRNKNGIASGVVFAHLGGDIGDSHSYRLGLSVLGTSPHDAPVNDTDPAGQAVVNTFTGTTRIAAADFVYKYAPNGNARDSSLKLQGEYFRRRENGTLNFDSTGVNIASSYSTTQSGWYLQGVYQFMPQWRMGLRFDRLDSGIVDVGSANSGNVAATGYNPSRSSLMFDYSPSEFSRFRLQFAQDKSRQDFTDRQIVLQYIFSLGAHGAHKF